jgi:type I restriction enzyme M protein
MQWIYTEYGHGHWQDTPDCEHYGDLTAYTDEIRSHLKRHFADLKEKQIKDLLASDTWLTQKQMLLKARQLQKVIGTAQFDDFNAYDDALKAAAKTPASRSTPKRKSRSPTQ